MTGTHATPEERLTRQLMVGGTHECWLWTGAVTPYGYGQLRLKDKAHQAHRAAHEFWIGPIPDGFHVDHECHNAAVLRGDCEGGNDCIHRRCCNPRHLVAKPGIENQRGGVQDWTAKDTCRNGHSPEFRHRTSGGATFCKRCRNDYRNKRRLDIKPVPGPDMAKKK